MWIGRPAGRPVNAPRSPRGPIDSLVRVELSFKLCRPEGGSRANGAQALGGHHGAARGRGRADGPLGRTEPRVASPCSIVAPQWMAHHAGGTRDHGAERRARAHRPLGRGAHAGRTEGAGDVQRRGGQERDGRDVRLGDRPADVAADEQRPPGRVGLLRRDVLARRAPCVGVRRGPGRHPRLQGVGDRAPHPGRGHPRRLLPRRHRLRAHSSRRPPVRGQQPGREVPPQRHRRGSAGAHRDGDRPGDRQDHAEDRPRSAARPDGRGVQQRGDQGLRHELGRPLRVGHRHDDAAEDRRHPALALGRTRCSPTIRPASRPTR